MGQVSVSYRNTAANILQKSFGDSSAVKWGGEVQKHPGKTEKLFWRVGCYWKMPWCLLPFSQDTSDAFPLSSSIRNLDFPVCHSVAIWFSQSLPPFQSPIPSDPKPTFLPWKRAKMPCAISQSSAGTQQSPAIPPPLFPLYFPRILGPLLPVIYCCYLAITAHPPGRFCCWWLCRNN